MIILKLFMLRNIFYLHDHDHNLSCVRGLKGIFQSFFANTASFILAGAALTTKFLFSFLKNEVPWAPSHFFYLIHVVL